MEYSTSKAKASSKGSRVAENVALISVLIGWELGLNTDMINELFMGGIFHDIGMAMLPQEIVYKKGPLVLEEKRHILQEVL